MICPNCGNKIEYDRRYGADFCKTCWKPIVMGSKYMMEFHGQRDGGHRSPHHGLFDNAVCYLNEKTFNKGEQAAFYYEATFDPSNPIHTIRTSIVDDVQWGDGDNTVTVLTENTKYIFRKLEESE